MYIPFDEMSPSARIWIYQGDRQFSDEEEKIIQDKTRKFLTDWAAHGNPLSSSFRILHKKFLVIAVDETFNMASGCSIDASVGLVRELQSSLEVNFFDRTKVTFLLNDEVFQCSMTDIKELITQGKIDSNTITFNNLVTNIDGLNSQWKIPASESWLKRYF